MNKRYDAFVLDPDVFDPVQHGTYADSVVQLLRDVERHSFVLVGQDRLAYWKAVSRNAKKIPQAGDSNRSSRRIRATWNRWVSRGYRTNLQICSDVTGDLHVAKERYLAEVGVRLEADAIIVVPAKVEGVQQEVGRRGAGRSNPSVVAVTDYLEYQAAHDPSSDYYDDQSLSEVCRADGVEACKRYLARCLRWAHGLVLADPLLAKIAGRHESGGRYLRQHVDAMALFISGWCDGYLFDGDGTSRRTVDIYSDGTKVDGELSKSRERISEAIERQLACQVNLDVRVHLTRSSFNERHLGLSNQGAHGNDGRGTVQRCVKVEHDFHSFWKLMKQPDESNAALLFPDGFDRSSVLSEMNRIRVAPGCHCCRPDGA